MYVVWDIGGPLRNSSKQMQYSHIKGAKKSGLFKDMSSYLKMDDSTSLKTWKLFGLTQNIGKDPKFFDQNDRYRDYKAFMLALYIISKNGIPIEKVFNSEWPSRFIAELVKRGPLDQEAKEKVYEAGKVSKETFGTEEAKGYSVVSEGAIEALKILKKLGIKTGIITSAPSGTTEGWLKRYIEVHTGEVFDRMLIIEDAINKVEALLKITRIALRETNSEILYIADTRSDMSAVEEANKVLVKEGVGKQIVLAMVKNGMGVENEWNAFLKHSSMEVGKDLFIFNNSLEAVKNLVQ